MAGIFRAETLESMQEWAVYQKAKKGFEFLLQKPKLIGET